MCERGPGWLPAGFRLGAPLLCTNPAGWTVPQPPAKKGKEADGDRGGDGDGGEEKELDPDKAAKKAAKLAEKAAKAAKLAAKQAALKAKEEEAAKKAAEGGDKKKSAKADAEAKRMVRIARACAGMEGGGRCGADVGRQVGECAGVGQWAGQGYHTEVAFMPAGGRAGGKVWLGGGRWGVVSSCMDWLLLGGLRRKPVGLVCGRVHGLAWRVDVRCVRGVGAVLVNA
eukprot:352188-Chlamydomonas_euryale.AAC.2